MSNNLKDKSNFLIFMKKLILGILAAFVLLSCSDKTDQISQVEKAAYYWQSDYYYSNEGKNPLKDNGIQTLYVKYFEIDYNDARGDYPFSKTSLRGSSMLLEGSNIKVIPTIFIKNTIFQYNSNQELDKLADNIVFLVDKYNKEKFEKHISNEIQIDCDWTKSTQQKYFYLLKKIKELSNKKISCTLRLYPFAYPQDMGVPPVDKATLMCYNLIKPLSDKNKNSILDIDELKKYLKKNKAYPLHLDVALPIFYWAHWYQNNQFVGLVDLTEKEVSSFAILKNDQQKSMWYEVSKDTVVNYKTYLRKGDVLKCEAVDAKTLIEVTTLLKKHIAFDKKIRVSLFDVQEKQFNQYTHEEIFTIYDSFTK